MSLFEKLKHLAMTEFMHLHKHRAVPESCASRKKRVAVVGVGSAGLLTLAHFCTWLDESWEVYSIHNPAKPILGIGESTNGEFVSLLEKSTHFFLGNQSDLDALDATLKFGSRFQNWRDHSWINPLLDGNVAIHFNNFKFKHFVFDRLTELWPRQFRVLEGDVSMMVTQDDHAIVTVDDVDHAFDFVVDCMGTPKDFRNYVISDCSPVNRCQIHNVIDYHYEPFTDHIAHANGWMFGVPLQGKKSYGYLYNDTITSKEDALADMKSLLGVDEIDNKEYVLKSYYARQLVQGRIGKNGNKALFFEPLVANSMFVYLYANRCLYDYMMGTVCEEETNAGFMKVVQEMEDVISYYYQGGTIFDSPFWDYAKDHTTQRLANRPEFTEIMSTYRTLKNQGLLYTAPIYGYKPLTWELVDKQMGYGYVSGVSTGIEALIDDFLTDEYEQPLSA